MLWPIASFLRPVSIGVLRPQFGEGGAALLFDDERAARAVPASFGNQDKSLPLRGGEIVGDVQGRGEEKRSGPP